MRPVALLIVLALPLVVPAGGALVPPLERAGLDVTGWTDATTALPLGAPAPALATGIGPGSHLLIDRSDGTYACTANWVWRSAGALHLGAAGHCFLQEGETATHGPGADADVSALSVRVCVADCRFGGQTGFLLEGTTRALGPVAYARQTVGGKDVGNDFGLVRIPDELAGEVRTGLPVWGAAPAVKEVRAGALTCHYGNGMAVGETFPTMARLGVGYGSQPDGSWRIATASAPGDSGAALATCVADAEGTRAVAASGVLTHLAGGLVAGTTMARAQQMALEARLSVAPVLG